MKLGIIGDSNSEQMDLNAAKNIKMIGLVSIITPREPRVGPVELSVVAEVQKQETPPIRME